MQITRSFSRPPQFVPSILALTVCICVFVLLAKASPPFQTPTINWPNGASYNAPVNPFAASGFKGECTAFAWGRAHEVTGVSLPFSKHAKLWYSYPNIQKGSEPRRNSLAVWDGSNEFGHVAYVEDVVGDMVSFTEANVLTHKKGGGYDRSIKKLTKSQMRMRPETGIKKLLGYIYLPSVKTVSPNGSERWTIGSTQTIRWTYTGDPASVGGGVSIEVLRGDAVVYTVPASIIIGKNGSGSFGWTIPSSLVPDSSYRVRVVSSMKVSDLSDQHFTLVGSRVVVTSSLQVSPGGKEQNIGQPFTGSFTITNRGNADAVLDKIVIGGLRDGKCGNSCPDFTPFSLRTKLPPGRSYKYSGVFIPLRGGLYTFLVAYQKPDGKWEKPVEADTGKVNEVNVTVKNWSLFARSNKRGSALVKWFPDETNDSKRIPLILVHGIHGSDKLDKITDKGDYWKAFLARFNGELKETYSLYAFQYYSDQDGVQDLAKQLGKSIDDRLGDRPHVLLAHSMGGLVAKSYMVDYRHGSGKWAGRTGGDSTLLLLTLATPHHGTPGANDVDAIEKYMRTGWPSVFSVVNFVYWTDAAGFRSPPAQSSDAYNRSDLRWDNYDKAISSDANGWLSTANGQFKGYASKVIAYAGALKFSEMSAAGAAAKLVSLVKSNDRQRLAFANNTMVNGLDRRFGITDGLVPYNSAALCDAGPWLISASNTTFLCSSPTRVRRFEPGKTATLTPDAQTLSINRRPEGYDHLDMLDHPHVLDWVVNDLAIGPKPRVSASLQFSPSAAYQVGQPINGSFRITNRGKTDLFTQRVVIGGRLAGTCPNNKCPDFGPVPGNITLRPNESYNYAGSFTPAQAGNYTFAVAYENSEGKWTMPVEAENNNKNQLSITVTNNLPNVVVSRSLTIGPGGGPFPVGQVVNGTFSITNRGNVALTMRQVLIGGRLGGNCPNNVCPDFSPVSPNITLNPGQTYNYSGKIALNKPGSYTFYVAYQTPDGKWEMPVKPEGGAANQQSVLVQPPGPVLTKVSPTSVPANANPQAINLYGLRLANVIYAQLRLPNGSITYLYIPLNQVFKVNDGQMRISARFLGRGTYYVTVWTANGKSNEHPIVVY
jgi:triacylglycerol esterase/lipase EstA (alpha/beta hydrolase family)/surface antigen